MIIDGMTGERYRDGALVMHVQLPADKVAQIDILNIYKQGTGDVIEFLQDGFEASEALINGRRQSLAGYLEANSVELKLPLVADYAGALVNQWHKICAEQDHHRIAELRHVGFG